jgi:putative inorganic carbon (HCO3(-)) transporter
MKLKSPQVSRPSGFLAQASSGALVRQMALPVRGAAPEAKGMRCAALRRSVAAHGTCKAAFAGVYLFTLLLYARPNDLFPALGTFPLVKIVAISITLIYLFSKIQAGKGITLWANEIAMLFIIALLGLLFLPISASPNDSYTVLTDPYLKTVLIFILMINLIDTRRRLLALWKLVVICGAVLGLGAIKSYAKGEFTLHGLRIEGLVGGIFGNPNDLATALDLLLPFAIVLAMLSKGPARLLYLLCAAAMAIGVLVTFSRGGFLGLVALGVVLLWKLGRGRRMKTILTAALVCGVMYGLTPGGYGNRMTTIFNIEQDQTGSAQERRALMELAASMALRRPIVGIGMGNFHIYSFHEKEAHNSYLEIAAELGVVGLLAYLCLIFKPMISLRRIEHDSVKRQSPEANEMYWLSVCLQGAFVAYMVCSFFASIQYLWYLYYTAAYAVALRQIHAAEQAVKEKEGSLPNSQVLISEPVIKSKRAGGVLWPSYRLRQGAG